MQTHFETAFAKGIFKILDVSHASHFLRCNCEHILQNILEPLLETFLDQFLEQFLETFLETS